MATKAIARRRVIYRQPVRRHARAKTRIPLAIVAGMVPLGVHAIDDYRAGGVKLAGYGLCARVTGYNPTTRRMDWGSLLEGWTPILAGVLVHKVAGRLGINRLISQNTKLPISI